MAVKNLAPKAQDGYAVISPPCAGVEIVENSFYTISTAADEFNTAANCILMGRIPAGCCLTFYRFRNSGDADTANTVTLDVAIFDEDVTNSNTTTTIEHTLEAQNDFCQGSSATWEGDFTSGMADDLTAYYSICDYDRYIGFKVVATGSAVAAIKIALQYGYVAGDRRIDTVTAAD